MLEVPLALGLARARRWPVSTARLLAVAVASSLLTHPFAWHGMSALAPHLPRGARYLLVEGLVALAEGALYARLVPLSWRRGLLLGLFANGFSFGLGLLAFRWLRA